MSKQSLFTRTLVPIDAAAEHLGVCTKTIRNYIAEGRLTGYRVGRLIRLDAAEVDALAAPIPTAAKAGR